MENVKKVTVSVGEILYWLFFGSLLFAKGIGLYDGQAVFKFVLVFACLCLFAKIAIEKYTVPEMIRMAAVIGLTGLTYVASGEKGLFLYGLMMVGMKYVDMKRLFTIGTILWTTAFLGVTITSLFHMDDTVYKVHAKLGMGHIFRWSLGYPHPNVLQVSYLILAIFILYMLGDQFRIKHALWLFAGNCLVFLYSVSYTGFAVFMCLLIGRIYLMYRKKLNIFEKFMLQLIFPLCVLLSLVAPVTIKGKLFNILNQLLSTRMELAWRYLKPEYMSLWGVKLSEITTETITMDNAYLSAFITYGAIPFGILCLTTMYMIFTYLKENKYLEALIILTIAVGGLTEPFLYNTSFKNLSFVFMGALLFGNKKNRKEKNLILLNKLYTLDKKVILNITKPLQWFEKTLRMFSYDRKKCLAGVIGAVIIGSVSWFAISYPAGYVVYRTDCADLTKNKNYYDEQNSDYVDYKMMGNFEKGDEIEYFSGNIVIMEKFRNGVLGICVGYIIGYVGCVLVWQEKKRKE